MSDKKVNVTINGQEVVCDFGVNYLYKHFRESTGKDLLGNAMDNIASSDMFDTVPALYFAGYRADHSLRKESPTLTMQDFVDHFYAADIETVRQALSDYMDIIIPGWNKEKAEGE